MSWDFPTKKQWDCAACEDTHEGCQECCPHDEHDHFICLYCEKELDPGAYIDAAEYMYGEER